MEKHREYMKHQLAEGLRILMHKNLLEKITIKQICDECHVIRATFYNYFDDKYDCLNYIVYLDINENINDSIGTADFQKALNRVMDTIEKNKDFYRTAYQVIGQNSFEDMIRTNLRHMVNAHLVQSRVPGYLDCYSNELLAGYYAEGIAYVVRMFVFDKGIHSKEEAKQLFLDMMNSSFYDLIEKE